MFGGTLCSNRHGFYRQAELGNRLCTYVASVRSVGSSVLCAVSGKACNYVLAPCLRTCRATANLRNDDGNEQTADGWGVSDVAHTLSTFVVWHTRTLLVIPLLLYLLPH